MKRRSLVLVLFVASISACSPAPPGVVCPIAGAVECQGDGGEGADGSVDAGAGAAAFITDQAIGLNYNAYRGQHFDGVTYFTFGGAGQNAWDPMIMSYDHRTRVVTGPVKIGDNPLAATNDHHGNPGMIVDRNGFLHVAYGGHGNLPGSFHHYARSTRPRDITAWTHVDNIEPSSTYPSFVELQNGALFIFFRAGLHESDWVYRTSTDGGNTWSPKVALLSGGTARTDGVYFEGPYVDAWYAHGNGFHRGASGTTIHATFQYHAHTNAEAATKESQTYSLQRHTDVFHATMHSDGSWHCRGAAALTLPITREVAQAQCRVYESVPRIGFGLVDTTYLAGLSTPADDTPFVHFAHGIFDGMGVKDPKPEIYFRAGNGWSKLASLPGGGHLVVSTHLAMDLYAGRFQYRTSNAGVSWEVVRSFAEGIPTTGALIHDFHPDAKRLLFNLTASQERLYLWGDSGFIAP